MCLFHNKCWRINGHLAGQNTLFIKEVFLLSRIKVKIGTAVRSVRGTVILQLTKKIESIDHFQTTFDTIKFSMHIEARLRGHKERKLNDHVYSFWGKFELQN